MKTAVAGERVQVIFGHFICFLHRQLEYQHLHGVTHPPAQSISVPVCCNVFELQYVTNVMMCIFVCVFLFKWTAAVFCT